MADSNLLPGTARHAVRAPSPRRASAPEPSRSGGWGSEGFLRVPASAGVFATMVLNNLCTCVPYPPLPIWQVPRARCLLERVEVGLGGRGLINHGRGAGLPAGGAHLAVRVGVLEGLDEAKDLVGVAADGEVVNSLLAEDTLGGNDEEAAEGDASVVALLDEDLVVLGDGLGDVGHEGVLAAAEAALLAGLRGPGEVAVLGIHGHADDLAVDVLELLRAIGEGADLGGAHEGEVEGVEEEDDVLALVVRELDVLEIAVGHHRRGGEVGGGLLDGEGHGGECTMRSVLAEDRDHKRNPNFSRGTVGDKTRS
mmetsp:Transcript_29093/g.92857  ORF Transcript_29093/g.92857 Transcript_29093/m.92857 type:complete len:310 (+) Transcript_29093:111-1040(+)